MAWPLELGFGTRNPRFVPCMVVESRYQSLGRRQKELAANKKERDKGNDGLMGVGTLFGGRNFGKPMKVGRTWGYG